MSLRSKYKLLDGFEFKGLTGATRLVFKDTITIMDPAANKCSLFVKTNYIRQYIKRRDSN